MRHRSCISFWAIGCCWSGPSDLGLAARGFITSESRRFSILRAPSYGDFPGKSYAVLLTVWQWSVFPSVCSLWFVMSKRLLETDKCRKTCILAEDSGGVRFFSLFLTFNFSLHSFISTKWLGELCLLLLMSSLRSTVWSSGPPMKSVLSLSFGIFWGNWRRWRGLMARFLPLMR